MILTNRTTYNFMMSIQLLLFPSLFLSIQMLKMVCYTLFEPLSAFPYELFLQGLVLCF